MSVNDVLTEEEVEALLHDVETGAIQPGEPERHEDSDAEGAAKHRRTFHVE
ncbi:MAG: hypothetical protein P8Y25_12905 [Chromatiaceae bacterium]